MKRLLFILIAFIIAGTVAFAQSETGKVDAHLQKFARKEAKSLRKEGWIVPQGQKPLEDQLIKSYLLHFDYDDAGHPKYISAASISSGIDYDSAKANAMASTKMQLVQMVLLTAESSVAYSLEENKISSASADTIIRFIKGSAQLLAEKLDQAEVVVECYRKAKTGATEVQLVLVCDVDSAFGAAQDVVLAQMDREGYELRDQLDVIWAFN